MSNLSRYTQRISTNPIVQAVVIAAAVCALVWFWSDRDRASAYLNELFHGSISSQEDIDYVGDFLTRVEPEKILVGFDSDSSELPPSAAQDFELNAIVGEPTGNKMNLFLTAFCESRSGLSGDARASFEVEGERLYGLIAQDSAPADSDYPMFKEVVAARC